MYLLHYIVLVLFDHWLFGGSGVSGDRPAVVGSLLLLIIPLMLLIAYPFFMYIAELLTYVSNQKPDLKQLNLNLNICTTSICRPHF